MYLHIAPTFFKSSCTREDDRNVLSNYPGNVYKSVSGCPSICLLNQCFWCNFCIVLNMVRDSTLFSHLTSGFRQSIHINKKWCLDTRKLLSCPWNESSSFYLFIEVINWYASRSVHCVGPTVSQSNQLICIANWSVCCVGPIVGVIN